MISKFTPVAIVSSLCGLLLSLNTQAETFLLPSDETNIVGDIKIIKSRYEDTLSDIARQHHVGYREITLANPGVDPWLPGEGTDIVIPSQFILPDAPRTGVVLNLAEMRLYYYPKTEEKQASVVRTYPISIGREGWETPLGSTRIVRKVENPPWYPPASIREEHEAAGDPLPKRVPPGPDNPLGNHALRLGFPGYLIHSTNKPYGVGMQVSHGCIRMYPEDIANLFDDIPEGTPVEIVNQPYKSAWTTEQAYLEVHHLPGDNAPSTPLSVLNTLTPPENFQGNFALDMELVEKLVIEGQGIPTVITKQEEQTQQPEEEGLKEKK